LRKCKAYLEPTIRIRELKRNGEEKTHLRCFFLGLSSVLASLALRLEGGKGLLDLEHVLGPPVGTVRVGVVGVTAAGERGAGGRVIGGTSTDGTVAAAATDGTAAGGTNSDICDIQR
jgi:hypothetical protein